MTIEEYVNYATHSFTLPDICLKIRAILDDSRSDMDDIGNIIAVDPSLTAKILKLANSALFRFPSQVDSISKAISVIGGEALYNLVITETANLAFTHFDSEQIRIEKHWRESVYCGMLAKYLAKQARLRVSERFFVMGILQNLSELVVAKHSPDSYRQYKGDTAPLLPWEKQLAHFGFTFSQCSGVIMESWHLPMPLYYPVKHVSEVSKQANEADIALLACAMRVTIRETAKDEYGGIEIITTDIAKKLSVEGETLGNAISFANKETDKISALIL